jgi:uronate dehydrogenase
MSNKKENQKLNVLFLGATGRIGIHFINDYFTHKYDKDYDLILGLRDPTKLKDERYEIKRADVSDIESLKEAMKGIDVVLNLAGNASPQAEFNDLIEPNIIGTYNVLEAARLSGVKRVIMASSVHAVKGYHESELVKEFDSPKPENFYGATKAFVEAMCHVYSKKFNLSCIAIRIGAYISDNMRETVCLTRDNYDYVISQRDMAQLFHKTIIAPLTLKYAILHGSSDNAKKKLDLKCTKKLVNYAPEDDSHKLKEECLKKNGK